MPSQVRAVPHGAYCLVFFTASQVPGFTWVTAAGATSASFLQISEHGTLESSSLEAAHLSVLLGLACFLADAVGVPALLFVGVAGDVGSKSAAARAATAAIVAADAAIAALLLLANGRSAFPLAMTALY